MFLLVSFSNYAPRLGIEYEDQFLIFSSLIVFLSTLTCEPAFLSADQIVRSIVGPLKAFLCQLVIIRQKKLLNFILTCSLVKTGLVLIVNPFIIIQAHFG